MAEAGAVIRIGLMTPSGGAHTPRASVLETLQRLGAVEIDLVSDVDACGALATRASLDLVVTDAAAPADIASLSALLGEEAPPLLAVLPEVGSSGAERAALLRAGAYEAVEAGPDLERDLRDAARDGVRDFRRGRDFVAATQRVRALERYHENFLESLNIALLEVDVDGVIRHANLTAGVILGGREESVAALSGRRLWEWFPEQEEGTTGACLRSGQKCQGVETEWAREEAPPVPIGLACAPLRDEHEQLIGGVLTLQDLSEQRQLQERTRQTEKLASLGKIVGGVAHEIRNPMAIISTNLSPIRDGIEAVREVWSEVGALRAAISTEEWTIVATLSEQLGEQAAALDLDFVLGDLPAAVADSTEAAERVRHIVNDLSDFGQRDTGHHDWADLNDCVESTANIARTLMKHSVDLEKEYATLPPLRCSSLQLKQVVMNLLINAYQSIEQRRAKDDPRGRVVLRTREAGGGVEFEIEDDGMGIAEENLKYIFDPYFTTKEGGEGGGLGLAISHKIVHGHGGWIQPESNAAGGATFRIWLPIDGGRVEASTASEPASGDERVPVGR